MHLLPQKDEGQKEGHLHTCGEYKCPSCTYYVQPGHLCFQRALQAQFRPILPSFVFYDFETTQYDVVHECR